MPRPAIVVVDDAATGSPLSARARRSVRPAVRGPRRQRRRRRSRASRSSSRPKPRSPSCCVALPLLSAEGSGLLDEAGGCIPIRSVRLSSAGMTPATGSSARRSSTRSRAVASTTTCSGRRRLPTSSSITRSPGLLLDWAESQRTSPVHRLRRRRVVVGPGVRAPGGARTLRDAAHVLPGRLARTGRRSSPRPAPTASCRWSCSPTARSCTTPPTPSWRRRPARR